MVILATVIAIALIAFMLLNNKNMKTYNQYMKRMKKLQESISNFTATQQYTNQNMAIAINNEAKKLVVSTMKSGEPVPLTYTFNDIRGCEIIEHKVCENTASINGNQKVASVLSDSVGKVISGDEQDRVNRIDLKISFKDGANPEVLLNFLYWEVTKDSDEYQKAFKDVSHWHGVINSIIKSS